MSGRRRAEVGFEADPLMPKLGATAAGVAGMKLVQGVFVDFLPTDRVEWAGRLGCAGHRTAQPILVVDIVQARHKVSVVGVRQDEGRHDRAALQLGGFGFGRKCRLFPGPRVGRLLGHGHWMPCAHRLRRLRREGWLGGWRGRHGAGICNDMMLTEACCHTGSGLSKADARLSWESTNWAHWGCPATERAHKSSHRLGGKRARPWSNCKVMRCSRGRRR